MPPGIESGWSQKHCGLSAATECHENEALRLDLDDWSVKILEVVNVRGRILGVGIWVRSLMSMVLVTLGG